jgi:hypothetical protein
MGTLAKGSAHVLGEVQDYFAAHRRAKRMIAASLVRYLAA